MVCLRDSWSRLRVYVTGRTSHARVWVMLHRYGLTAEVCVGRERQTCACGCLRLGLGLMLKLGLGCLACAVMSSATSSVCRVLVRADCTAVVVA